MKVLTRDPNDPLTILKNEEVGGLNIIDLANIYSCPFIETEDLGVSFGNSFSILGRMNNSDLRGCNLMIS